jgi:hypothetical protein
MFVASFIAPSAGRSIRSITAMVALAATFAAATPVQAVTIPFTETFAVDNANWSIGSSTVYAAATWNATGGPSGGTFISRLGSGTGSPFSGPTIFRGQDNFDSSGDAFVGDWIAAGVGTFSVDFFHDHSSALNVSVRFANAFNDPGASSVNFLVDPSTWTTLTIPIVDSTSSFQTYGSLGSVPNSTSFNTIFSSIGNIQLSLPTGTDLPSVTFGLANPTIAPVPEPGTWAVIGAAAAAGLGIRLRRRGGTHAA